MIIHLLVNVAFTIIQFYMHYLCDLQFKESDDPAKANCNPDNFDRHYNFLKFDTLVQWYWTFPIFIIAFYSIACIAYFPVFCNIIHMFRSEYREVYHEIRLTLYMIVIV